MFFFGFRSSEECAMRRYAMPETADKVGLCKSGINFSMSLILKFRNNEYRLPLQYFAYIRNCYNFDKFCPIYLPSQSCAAVLSGHSFNGKTILYAA